MSNIFHLNQENHCFVNKEERN